MPEYGGKITGIGDARDVAIRADQHQRVIACAVSTRKVTFSIYEVAHDLQGPDTSRRIDPRPEVQQRESPTSGQLEEMPPYAVCCQQVSRIRSAIPSSELGRLITVVPHQGRPTIVEVELPSVPVAADRDPLRRKRFRQPRIRQREHTGRDRPTLVLVAVQERRRRSELPPKVVRILNARIHSLPTSR